MQVNFCSANAAIECLNFGDQVSYEECADFDQELPS